MESMLQSEKECFFCGQKTHLERHHVMPGPNRKNSEKYGLTVWLCHEHHTGDTGVHMNRTKDEMLRYFAQKRFEDMLGHELWMQVFGKNYLPNYGGDGDDDV